MINCVRPVRRASLKAHQGTLLPSSFWRFLAVRRVWVSTLRCVSIPYLATVAHVRITLQRWLQGSGTSESFLVLGLILAIQSVLEDCAHEHLGRAAEDWSPATRRLLRYGVLIDADGALAVIGETETPLPDRIGRARVDLELWREVTTHMLEHDNLEQAIKAESVRQSRRPDLAGVWWQNP